ncbi:MAG: phosphate/phosphite/phosphonate ABC transporter substrate-binding protein [Gemmataceae bacterium]|nr:phosphate/phosphite/phosphonate ABC transporter substrate-binding protein [Gemmataceae bacterium]MCS7269509.1 phosphate/phosphite/phosphonate ABC transporter substrate-binding protein [Gemmataceae bacterium]MDW8242832.1 PhnD/SsuA/transferrin family substrate-binding protein [Thermogemmata sp.]
MVRGFVLVVAGLSLWCAKEQSAQRYCRAADTPVATANRPAENTTARFIRVGFPAPLFRDVPEVLIQAAATPFKKTLYKELGIHGDMVVVPDYKTLAEQLRDGKLEMGVFHGFEYAWIKDTPGIVPLVVTQPCCGRVQACLVVRDDCPAQGPHHLKGACIALPRGTKAHCLMFLERLRSDPTISPGDCCPIKAFNTQSTEEVLDAVVAGTCTAAMVDIAALLAYQELKPGPAQRLKILVQSKPLPPAVIVWRKGALSPEQLAKIRDGLLSCHKTPIGRTFTNFWQLECFKEVTPEYLALVEECAKHYPPAK